MPTNTEAIFGNTYAVREQLKALGGRWDSQFKCWNVPAAKADQARALVAAAPARNPETVEISLDRYRRSGKSYTAQCPSCALRGEDTDRNNLSIKRTDPTIYHCWKGCTTEEIKQALGLDSGSRIEFVAEPGKMR